MEDEKEVKEVKEVKKCSFFSILDERIVDLITYANILYYISIIETMLYIISIVGIPLVGFTLMAMSFGSNPCYEKVNIYVRWRYMIMLVTVVMICAIALFTNWPKCTSELLIVDDKQVWKTICRGRGTPYGLFFPLLTVVFIEMWMIYIAEMYRLKYSQIQNEKKNN